MPQTRTTTVLTVTADIPGLHKWPNAPDTNLIVACLRNTHRHLFKVSATFTLPTDTHSDSRNLEFFTLRQLLLDAVFLQFPKVMNLNTVDQDTVNFGNCSCEGIAQIVLDSLIASHEDCHKYLTSVSVWEDGENGAKVEIQG